MSIATTIATSEPTHLSQSHRRGRACLTASVQTVMDNRPREAFRCTDRELADLRHALHAAVHNLKYQASPLGPSKHPPNCPSSLEQARIWTDIVAARRTFRDMLTGARFGGPSVVKPAGFEAGLEDAKRALMIEVTGGEAEGCTDSPRLQDVACYVLRCTEEELTQLKSAIVEAEAQTYHSKVPQDLYVASCSDTVYEAIWRLIAVKRSKFRDMLSCSRWVEKPVALTWEVEVVKLNLMDEVFCDEPVKLARLEMLYRDVAATH